MIDELTATLTATRSTISPSIKIITHNLPPDRDDGGPSRTLRMDLRTRRSVQQQSTATTSYVQLPAQRSWLTCSRKLQQQMRDLAIPNAPIRSSGHTEHSPGAPRPTSRPASRSRAGQLALQHAEAGRCGLGAEPLLHGLVEPLDLAAGLRVVGPGMGDSHWPAPPG
jgi:hypothetical protein